MAGSLDALDVDIWAEARASCEVTDPSNGNAFVGDDEVDVKTAGLVKLDGADVLGPASRSTTSKTFNESLDVVTDVPQVNVPTEPERDPVDRQAPVCKVVEAETDPLLGGTPILAAAGGRRAPCGGAGMSRKKLARVEVDVPDAATADAVRREQCVGIPVGITKSTPRSNPKGPPPSMLK